MERTIKNIARGLADTLPGDRDHFTLEDLRENGFPRFVVKRVGVELERNLTESILLPETEWADMSSETVRKAWNQFVNAIHDQSRLPASYAYAVVETAISDIVEILVQPRKNLPEVIFGASDRLGFDEIVARAEAIVVYRHFAAIIARYMEKKGLSELSKEQCGAIITKADEKLTRHYTPLNWAQMLEPLFILAGEQIESDLIRQFFEDKNKPALARRFDLMGGALNRSQFIEVLSSPDLLEDKEPQNELFTGSDSSASAGGDTEGSSGEGERAETGEEMGADPVATFHGKRDRNVEAPQEDEPAEEPEQEPEEEEEKEKEPETGSLNAVFSDDASSQSEEDPFGLNESEDEPVEESDPETDSLNAAFSEPEDAFAVEYREPEESQPEEAEKEEEPEPPAPVQNEPEEEERPVAGDGATASEEPEMVGDEEEIDEDSPMWLRFVDESPEGEDSDPVTMADEHPEGEEYDDMEPLIDLTSQEPDEEIVTNLRELLEDDRDRYIEEIFRGGEEAYEQALEEIASKEDWRTASRYIEKEVFTRNLVDMYSEAAVDFTDRLQTYFLESQ